MKQIFISATLILTGIFSMSAQQNQKELPLSFGTDLLIHSEIPFTQIHKPDVKALLEEDKIRDKQGKFYRTGIIAEIPTHSAIKGKYSFEGNNVIWQHGFTAPEAKSIGLYFDYLTIPEGGKLFVYSPDLTHVVGPFTPENSPNADVFATAPVAGESLILEYNGPKETAEMFEFILNEVSYHYRNGGFGPKNASNYGDSDPCEVNANCSEGDSWDAQKRAAVKIIVKDGSSTGLCSGALINSTNNDCTPYILTANHCGGGASVANFKQWIFYFNFETPGCTNPPSASNLDDQVVTGCLKMSNSSDVSDVIASDFLLVHIKNRPANSFNAYMAGWSVSTVASGSGVSIHHPAGDVKKISTYTSTLTNSGWSGGNFGKHWGVIWSATANGHGVTEGGSSGSPIFNSAGLIVGQLSGGSSFCSNTNGMDVYGKFSYSWDQTANTPNRRLKDWLDKANINPTTFVGKEVNTCASATLPTVEFVADNTTPSVGQPVNLTNQSTGTADGYLWTITPNTFSYVNGTDENSENPQVIFNSTSPYSVVLHVYNNAGYSLRSRPGYIKPHSVAGIGENENSAFTIYPNPCNGLFLLSAQSGKLIDKVTLTDLNGKTIAEYKVNATAVEINQKELSRGVYLLNILSEGKQCTEKLVIKE
jgi:hypothetical protein